MGWPGGNCSIRLVAKLKLFVFSSQQQIDRLPAEVARRSQPDSVRWADAERTPEICLKRPLRAHVKVESHGAGVQEPIFEGAEISRRLGAGGSLLRPFRWPTAED